MDEQKYYVRLKSPNNHGIWWCGDRSEWKSYSLEPVYGEDLGVFREVIGWKVPKFIQSFTKSELGKIMGGAIYKGCILPDGHEFGSDCKPWINPLIKLVPVEDGE